MDRPVSIPPEIINKRVPLRFMGADLKLDLSQSLFSSYGIDRGSLQLLKTIAQHSDPSGWREVMDAGCGVGPLGLALKRRFPHLDITLVDRDALALDLAAHNARTNGLSCQVRGSLILDETAYDLCDAVVCNIPAKVGTPVLGAMLRTLALLARQLVVVVIVAPLAPLVAETLSRLGLVPQLVDETREHAVFHYGALAGTPDVEDAFIRRQGDYTLGPWRYQAGTVYGLSDFDTVSHRDELAAQMVQQLGVPTGGRFLFWNPGQGHLATALARSRGGRTARFVLGSRDLLQLRATRANLAGAGVPVERIEAHHIAFCTQLAGSDSPFDLAVVNPTDDPGYAWQDGFFPWIRELLAPASAVLVAGKSTPIHRLLALRSGLIVRSDRKAHGIRCVILE